VDTYEKGENAKRIPLLSALKAYSERDVAAFDVPGHKRGKGVQILNDYFGENLMKMDVNSLPILDNVASPTGVIKEAQKLMADAYSADEAFFITNGTTSAIHCMLMSALSPGDKVLMPRNIHKSALNGLILCGGMPVYAEAEVCPIEGLTMNVAPAEIEAKLDENVDIKAVFLLNPTYYGYTADLQAIAGICHERGVLLLADEAHGAHFPFHEKLPVSAMGAGADISCVSVHKTGGALTQSSAMLVNTKRVNAAKVQQTINMLQSTSSSYLLMSSLDGARYNLVTNGHNQIENALMLRARAYLEMDRIEGISVVSQSEQFDATKLGINVSGLGLTGFQVYEILWKEFDIQFEAADFHHVLGIISLGSTSEHIDRLVEAFREISDKYAAGASSKRRKNHIYTTPKIMMSPRDAYFGEKEMVSLNDALGRISGESIMAYPPGIPIVAPGELITKKIITALNNLKNDNASVTDNMDMELNQILVIK